MKFRQLLCGLLLVVFCNTGYAQKGEFISLADYQQRIFGRTLDWQILWLNAAHRAELGSILQRKVASLRVRYLTDEFKTLWLLEEIGKELPISIGVVVADGKIADVSILTYRESRGGEVRYPRFTAQYLGASLRAGNELDRHIDGITGATLSVWAVTRAARAALFYDSLLADSRAGVSP